MSPQLRTPIVIVAALLAALACTAPALASPPSNDNFAAAATIDPSSLPFTATVDDTQATTESGEPLTACGQPQRTVWYRLLPTSAIAATFDLAGSGVTTGSIAVFRAVGPGLGDLLVENCANLDSSFTMSLQPSNQYYIRLGDFDAVGGLLHLSITRIPPPPNDAFANAAVVGSAPFSSSLDPITATTEPFEPSSGCGFSSGGTVWYAYTPPTDGTLQVSLDSALLDPGLIDVYTGTSLLTLARVGCGSFFGPAGPVSVHVTGGTKYYLQARPASSTARHLTVGLTFRADGPPAVANDNLADATVITMLPFSAVVDNTLATTEPGEPSMCGPTNQTVWYAYTPAANTVVTADTAGSAFAGSELGVYLRTGGGLSFAGCVFGGAPISFRANAGSTYLFQAGSFSPGGGSLHVNLRTVPPPPNDAFANATGIAALPFRDQLDLSGATLEAGEKTPDCYTPSIASAWYAVSPSRDGTFTGGLTSSVPFNFVAVFGVYTGSSLTDLHQVACNLGNPLRFDATKGTTYFIQVDVGVGLGGPTTFSLDFQPADSVPPVLTLPDSFSVDATNPNGAVVDYSATAVDAVDGPVPTSCSPAQGTTFAVGTTTVNCAASDAHGNTATGSFTVHVRGAGEQVARLGQVVAAVGSGTSLGDKLSQVQADLATNAKSDACVTLAAFVKEVMAQAGKKIQPGTSLPTQAGSLIAVATSIEAVVGC
jgi:hypothetical protein